MFSAIKNIIQSFRDATKLEQTYAFKTPKQLLEENKKILLDIYSTLDLTETEIKTELNPLLLLAAEYFYTLPSSEYHHHSYSGGALAHSLEVAFLSARSMSSKVHGIAQAIKTEGYAEVQLIKRQLMLSAILFSLLHDSGKPVTDMKIYFGLVKWEPTDNRFWEAFQNNNYTEPEIEWVYNRKPAEHDKYSAYFLPLWLKELNWQIKPSVLSYLMEAVNHIETNEILRTVKKYDRYSSAKGLKTTSAITSMSPLAINIKLAIESIISMGDWTKAPTFSLFNTTLGFLLKTPLGLDVIKNKLARQNIHLPSSVNKTLEFLGENGFILKLGDGTYSQRAEIISSDGKKFQDWFVMLNASSISIKPDVCLKACWMKVEKPSAAASEEDFDHDTGELYNHVNETAKPHARDPHLSIPELLRPSKRTNEAFNKDDMEDQTDELNKNEVIQKNFSLFENESLISFINYFSELIKKNPKTFKTNVDNIEVDERHITNFVTCSENKVGNSFYEVRQAFKKEKGFLVPVSGNKFFKKKKCKLGTIPTKLVKTRISK